MAARTTVVYDYAVKVVGDGQWHEYEKVIWEVTKSVPPQLAIRKAEESRVKQYLREHRGARPEDVPPRKIRASQDQLIRTGARQFVSQVLVNYVFECAMDPNGTKWVRLRPKEPEPLPEGWKHWRKEPPRKWAHLTPEQRREAARQQLRDATAAALAKHGINLDDPNYETRAEASARRRREYEALSEEEKAKYRREIAIRAARTKLIRRGIDPDTYVTKEQQAAQRKAELEAMTPEERRAIHSERIKRAWAEKRRAPDSRKESDG